MKRTLADIEGSPAQDEQDTEQQSPPQQKQKKDFSRGDDAQEEVFLTTTPSTTDSTPAEPTKESTPAQTPTPTSVFGAFGGFSAGLGFSGFTTNSFSSLGSSTSGFGGFSAFGTPADNEKKLPPLSTESVEVNEDGEIIDTSAHEDTKVSSKLQKREEQLGEEGEEQLYTGKAKVFELTWVDVPSEKGAHQPTFGSDAAEKKEKEKEEAQPVRTQKYTERGVGEIHLNLLVNGDKKTCRIVTRHVTKGSLLLNEIVYKAQTNVFVMDPNKMIRFTTIGVGDDGKPGVVTYLFRFADAEGATEFKDAVEKAKEQL